MKKNNNTEKIAEAIKKGNTDEITKAIDESVNSFGIPYREIINEIKSNQEVSDRFFELSVRWIGQCARLSSMRWMYDERNEYSYRISNDCLYPMDFIQEALAKESSFTKTAISVSAGIAGIHRTLQQSFSSLVFRYLKSRQKELGFSEIRRLSEKDPGWEITPYI